MLTTTFVAHVSGGFLPCLCVDIRRHTGAMSPVKELERDVATLELVVSRVASVRPDSPAM
jgi:hypothetical protein